MTASWEFSATSEVLSRLFDSSFRTAEVDPETFGPAELHPEERAAIARAVEKRQREFAAGRSLARRLMREFGIGDFALLNGQDRAPRWPIGIVGSITHTAGYCGVVVAPAGEVRAVGIDAEQSSDLRPELWDRICTDREQTWIRSHPAAQQGFLAKLHFSAKECAYKCQYPLSETYLEFHDLELDLDLATGEFIATYHRDDVPGFPRGERLVGRFRTTDRLIVCAMHLR